ncbi:hypothetical protein [Aurantimonas marina]|uniref:hypothetical protein n=1 Tax=Aurantimonas marina TaxID=2780508 RepID=UPI0019CF68FE|nr:hypothetical protein [Aurantimonas marina]
MRWKPVVMGLVLGVLASGPVPAQDKSNAAGFPLVSPFASATPGQTPPTAANEPPTALSIGVLHWAPMANRCAFVDPDRADTAVEGSQAFVFLTMTQSGTGTTAGPERGYVLANGLVRELEKGKTAPNKDGQVVTVWRSAGEPRINVNVVLDESHQENGVTRYSGSMTLFWGDKKESVSIAGQCAD